MDYIKINENSRPITKLEFNEFKNEINQRIDQINNTMISQIDQHMTKYLKNFFPKKNDQEIINEISKYIDYLKNVCIQPVDMIIVEGITDKKYIETAIDRLKPNLSDRIHNNELAIYANMYNGGVANINQYLYNRIIYNKNRFKTMVLYDYDIAGIEFKHKAINTVEYSELIKQKKLKLSYIAPSDDLLKIIEICKDKPYYSIENLLPIEFWKELKKKNLIEKYNIEYIINLIDKRTIFDDFNSNDYINKLNLDNITKDCYFGYKPKDDKKNTILNLALDEAKNNDKFFNGFQNTVNEIYDFFNNN